jgi:hypothetical protein
MNRTEIEIVASSWQRATADPGVLLAAIVERLTGPPRFRAERARWIIEAVTLLSPNLDRPTTFAAIAADLLAERIPITIHELEIERAALMGAIGELDDQELQDNERVAWRMAITLFAEIVASVCLDPFGDASTPAFPQTESDA